MSQTGTANAIRRPPHRPGDSQLQDRTAEFLDKQAILELVTTYGAALDDRDWKRLEGCFVQIVVDFGCAQPCQKKHAIVAL